MDHSAVMVAAHYMAAVEVVGHLVVCPIAHSVPVVALVVLFQAVAETRRVQMAVIATTLTTAKIM